MKSQVSSSQDTESLKNIKISNIDLDYKLVESYDLENESEQKRRLTCIQYLDHPSNDAETL